MIERAIRGVWVGAGDAANLAEFAPLLRDAVPDVRVPPARANRQSIAGALVFLTLGAATVNTTPRWA